MTMDWTLEQYRAFRTESLEQFLSFGHREEGDPDVDRELVKVRTVLKERRVHAEEVANKNLDPLPYVNRFTGTRYPDIARSYYLTGQKSPGDLYTFYPRPEYNQDLEDYA